MYRVQYEMCCEPVKYTFQSPGLSRDNSAYVSAYNRIEAYSEENIPTTRKDFFEQVVAPLFLQDIEQAFQKLAEFRTRPFCYQGKTWRFFVGEHKESHEVPCFHDYRTTFYVQGCTTDDGKLFPQQLHPFTLDWKKVTQSLEATMKTEQQHLKQRQQEENINNLLRRAHCCCYPPPSLLNEIYFFEHGHGS